MAVSPITYICSDEEVGYTPIDFAPAYTDSLYFVHLGQKQDSQQGIKDYIKKVKNKKNFVKEISAITDEVLDAKKLADFDSAIAKHEEVVSKAMGYEKVQDKYFSDYWGQTKSLGAWGGDFVVATSTKSEADTKAYFADKGMETCIRYQDMIL